MSNRILWILILIWFTGFWYLFYLIFFVQYTWTLEITSNIDNYSVELYAKKVYQTFNYDCKEKKCVIADLSPFNYDVTITSPSYKEIKQELILKWKKTNYIKTDFVKDTKLTEIANVKETNKNTEITKESTLEKIATIKIKKETDYTIDLWQLWFFYFKTNWNNLELFKKWENKDAKLWTFPKVDKKDIQIFEINGNTDKILISLKDRKYIYNLKLLKIDEFKLVPKIKYIKVGNLETNYLIITDVWTYTYDELSKELIYFYLFKDFVYLKDAYIWIINKDEKSKFTNFSLKDNKKNLIIKYNPSTKNREIILETDIEISKIIQEWENKIYFYNNTWKKYELENY
jgi:hypothetical protein